MLAEAATVSGSYRPKADIGKRPLSAIKQRFASGRKLPETAHVLSRK
jgi:hypothetical protein